MTLPPAYCPLDNQKKQKLRRYVRQAGGRVPLPPLYRLKGDLTTQKLHFRYAEKEVVK